MRVYAIEHRKKYTEQSTSHMKELNFNFFVHQLIGNQQQNKLYF